MKERGAWLAAAAAVFAAVPGLFFPFLSDDWHLIESVGAGAPPPTPYGYFRPLYTATFWLDRRLWGLSPLGFHATNLLLLAMAAFVLVVLLRRLTGNAGLSVWAGLLFALHPYHVENAAWIAVRGDPLYTVFFLASVWAYDRWRRNGAPRPAGSLQGTPHGVPLSAWVLFETALLAKESAVVLPGLLILLIAVRWVAARGDGTARTRAAGAELARGIAPMGLIAVGHFFLLRPLVMPNGGRSLAPGGGLAWMRHAAGYVVAAVLPVDAEILVSRPLLWSGAAALVMTALAAASWMTRRRIPGLAFVSAAAFVLLLAPSIIGFQERYLYLPVAASSLGLVSLVAELRPRARVSVALVITVLWLGGCVRHWGNWSAAAVTSRHLVAGLVAASKGPNVEEIALANVPFRVRGGSVAGDMRAAIALSGGRPVPVNAATYVSYPSALAPALRVDPGGESIPSPKEGGDVGASRAPDDEKNGRMPTLEVRAGDGFSEVRMWIQDGPFSHFVAPTFNVGTAAMRTPSGSLVFEGRETVLVKMDQAPERGRAAYAWAEGRLIPLFLPAKDETRERERVLE